MKYKDVNNNNAIHDDMGDSATLLNPHWPVGCVPITDAEVAALLAPPITLVRSQVWAAIKQKREAIKSGGVMVSGKWFHTDEPSRSQYGALLTKAIEASLPVDYVFEANWKTMDGTFAPMTVGTARAIRDAQLPLESVNFANAEAHRVMMEASATPETYDFSTGWPAIYVPA